MTNQLPSANLVHWTMMKHGELVIDTKHRPSSLSEFQSSDFRVQTDHWSLSLQCQSVVLATCIYAAKACFMYPSIWTRPISGVSSLIRYRVKMLNCLAVESRMSSMKGNRASGDKYRSTSQAKQFFMHHATEHANDTDLLAVISSCVTRS